MVGYEADKVKLSSAAIARIYMFRTSKTFHRGTWEWRGF